MVGKDPLYWFSLLASQNHTIPPPRNRFKIFTITGDSLYFKNESPKLYFVPTHAKVWTTLHPIRTRMLPHVVLINFLPFSGKLNNNICRFDGLQEFLHLWLFFFPVKVNMVIGNISILLSLLFCFALVNEPKPPNMFGVWMTFHGLTARPPFSAINDVAVLIPAHAALHVGCIAGGNVRLWKIKRNEQILL